MRLLVGTLVFVSLLSSVSSESSESSESSSPHPPPEDCSSMSVRLRAFRLKINCSFTTLKEKQLKEIQDSTMVLVLPVLYLVAFCVGLPSNLLALWVLVFRTKRLPSTVLLINLTAADCLLLAALPFRIQYHFRGNDWRLGEVSCRVVMALFYGNMYGSVLSLALVALDRYVALVHPFGARTLRGQRTSLYMSAAVWAAVLAAMLPLLVSQQTYRLDAPRITTCHDALPEAEQQNFFLPYFATLFAVGFLLPFAVVLFCHGAVLRTLLAGGRRYGHAARVTALVLVVFVVCLLPSNVLLLMTYGSTDGDGMDGEDMYVPYTLSLALSTFNSVLDPFIFYFVSVEFREKTRGALCCRPDNQRPSLGNVSYSSSSGQRSKVTVLTASRQSETA
ncbi:proteinase-activated receptor 4 [Centropristis striata]|uniref:proteinase-activated receptor 4 n=1 Tax=Centropristis striata TaxID=184440 RepID=UPI0027E1E25C|nr:proteinase-activated receptor 4 [Centropristis striata]